MTVPHEPTLRRDNALSAADRITRRAHLKWCCDRDEAIEPEIQKHRPGIPAAARTGAPVQQHGTGAISFNPRGACSTRSRSILSLWPVVLVFAALLLLTDPVAAGIGAVIAGEIAPGGRAK